MYKYIHSHLLNKQQSLKTRIAHTSEKCDRHCSLLVNYKLEKHFQNII